MGIGNVHQHLTSQRSESAQGDGTTSYYVDMRAYNRLGIQLGLTAGAAGDNTVTVHASNDDTVAQDSATYVDVTTAWFGAANYTADAFIEEPDACAAFVRIDVVRANDGGNNDGAWQIDIHKKG